MDTGEWILSILHESTTKEEFKEKIRTCIETMSALGDKNLPAILRYIAKYNAHYVENGGDTLPIKYGTHPQWGNGTIIITINDEPVSAGWKAMVNQLWDPYKEELKARKAASKPQKQRAARATKRNVSAPRGRGQVFEVNGSTPSLSPSEKSPNELLGYFYDDVCGALSKYESNLRHDDSLIAITIATGNRNHIKCMYVFQKRTSHPDLNAYYGSFHNNTLVVAGMEDASNIYVLDVGFVHGAIACDAEADVYRIIVQRFGTKVVPQIPVNGKKVVELSEDQEMMIGSWSTSHPVRPLLQSQVNTELF